jgi:hypothetical protein
VWGRRHSPLQLAQTNNARKRITVYANLSCGTLLIRISKLIKVMLHLHIFLKIKSLYDFYSLLIFLKTCEHLLIGNALYLSNWWMGYSRMIWHLLILAKYLGFISQNKIACSLNGIYYLPRLYMIIHDKNLPYMPLTLCWVLSCFVTPIKRCFMLPKSKLTYTHK